jgi:hypothetical protein
MSSLKGRLRAKKLKKRRLAIAEETKPVKKKGKVKVKTTVREEEKKVFTAGEIIKGTEGANCLLCMHWRKCPRPVAKKNNSKACSKLKLYPLKSGSVAESYTDKAINLILEKKRDKDAGLSKEERVISELISRTLAGSGVTAADSRIDDRDLPTAPNFATWISDQRYMGNLVSPWAKQIEHPTKLMAEWCPNKKCTDLEYWTNVPVDATTGDIFDRVTFLEHGKCPKCHATKSALIKEGKLLPYNALAGLAGQRLAKTFTATAMAGYDLQRFLKSQNPSAMLGLPGTQVLTGTFAALTFEQAKNMVWTNIHNLLLDSAWFQQYHALLKDQSYRYGIEDVFTVTNTAAKYRHRNLFYHTSGPSKRTMRGATRCTAMIDEIGWFTVALKGGKAGQDPERLDAQGVHDALDRSLLTVRGAAHNLLMSGGNENTPMGFLYEVSSPQSKNDMIMKRYEASRGSRTIYGYRMATWEGNPTLPRNSEPIVEAFRENPVNAMRDYGAVPPVSGNPFVKLSMLSNLFSDRRDNGGLLKTVRITNRAGQAQTSGKIKKLRPHRGEPSVLALDAGSVNNSFSFSVLYGSERTGRVICPFIGEIFPTPEAPTHFPDLAEGVMAQLIEHYNVGLVVSDRWQNIMLLQTLCEEHGVGFVARSLAYPDFDAFRQSAIFDGALLLPKLENKPKKAISMSGDNGYPYMYQNQPVSHLLYQLVAVNDVPNVTVAKPDGHTDDLFRSLVLGFTAITDPEYAEFFDNSTATQPALGFMVNSIGTGGGASVTTNIGVAVGPRNSVGGGTGSMGVTTGRQ